jgi:hypothetical protein
MQTSPIFIGGQMKSGTTMLRMLISKHSNIFSGLETQWFKKELYIEYSKKNNPAINKIKNFYDLNDIEIEHIIDNIDKNKSLFLDELFNYLAKRESKSRWLEKTPDNIEYYELISKNWVNYKFIHNIRDFRDTYASWKLSNKYDLDFFLKKVKLSLEPNKNILGKNSYCYYEVKYENLVLNTKEIMKDVLTFLEEDFEEECTILDNDLAKKEFNKVLKTANKESQTLISTQEPINNKKIGHYKNVLTDYEIKTIETELAEYFDIYEYKV